MTGMQWLGISGLARGAGGVGWVCVRAYCAVVAASAGEEDDDVDEGDLGTGIGEGRERRGFLKREAAEPKVYISWAGG